MNKLVHIVYGVRRSGSGTLTYPEDFDFIAAYEHVADAVEEARKLNVDVAVEEGFGPFEEMNELSLNNLKDLFFEMGCGEYTMYTVYHLELR